MKFKLCALLCFMATLLFANNSVTLGWNPSTSLDAAGYNIYYGNISGIYTVGPIYVGNVTNTTITNLIPGKAYYFVATTVDTNGQESAFSNEAGWTNVLNITYLGIKLDYGTNITSLQTQKVMVLAITNDPGYFYSESLIITNNPFIGTKPVGTNQYVYIGTAIQYGTNIFNLTVTRLPVTAFTNAPSYFYRSALVITNQPF